MGTKNSYSGGGGAVGDGLRDDLDDWLASLPGSDYVTNSAGRAENLVDDISVQASTPRSSDSRVLPAIALFKASNSGSSSGNSRKGGSDKLTRSAAGSARSAGRGAAAAYAYRTGDAQTLRDLGLVYAKLLENPNVVDVAHQIAQKVCEDLPAGTIETDEKLQVVGSLVEWIIESDGLGDHGSLGRIAEEAVALTLAEAYLVETASTLNVKDMTGAERAKFETGVRQVAEELASRAALAPASPTAAQFATAIESGLEYLRLVYEGV